MQASGRNDTKEEVPGVKTKIFTTVLEVDMMT